MYKELPFKSGDVIKNYKEMCKVLDEKVRAGSSRTSQLKRWEKYFEWEKSGYKFVITKIIDKKYPTHDDNKIGISVKSYSEDIQNLILHFLKVISEENKQYYLNISARGLISLLELFNPEFYKLQQTYISKEIQDKLSVRQIMIDDFYEKAHKTAKSDIRTALRQLQQKSFIMFSDIKLGRPSCPYHLGIPVSSLGEIQRLVSKYGVEGHIFDDYISHFGVINDQSYHGILDDYAKYSNGYINSRELHESELSIVTSIQNKIINDMGYKNMSNIIAHGRVQEFSHKISEEISPLGLEYFYSGYKIVFAPNLLKDKKLFNSLELAEEFKKKSEENLRCGFSDNIKNSYNKRKEISLQRTGHKSYVDFIHKGLVCENDYSSMRKVDRVLLGLEDFENVIEKLIEYFIK